MKKQFDIDINSRQLGILIDPDRHTSDELVPFLTKISEAKPDVLLLGSTLIHNSHTSEAAKLIKQHSTLPLVLFPGHFTHLTDEVDAVLLLSLISGRNADLLIGQHMLAAPQLAQMKAQIISTGYMLIDGGSPTSVSYVSNTLPIPRSKTDIALCTALAGQFIGMKLIYLDAGSGATESVPLEMVRTLKKQLATPIVVGGGIHSREEIEAYWDAGANLVVVGNALESKPDLLTR